MKVGQDVIGLTVGPLQYDRSRTHSICPSNHQLVAYQKVSDEEAREWARTQWDGGRIGYDWHPAIIAACEELRLSCAARKERPKENRCRMCGAGMCACGVGGDDGASAPYHAHCQNCDNKTEAIYDHWDGATEAWNAQNPESA